MVSMKYTLSVVHLFLKSSEDMIQLDSLDVYGQLNTLGVYGQSLVHQIQLNSLVLKLTYLILIFPAVSLNPSMTSLAGVSNNDLSLSSILGIQISGVHLLCMSKATLLTVLLFWDLQHINDFNNTSLSSSDVYMST